MDRKKIQLSELLLDESFQRYVMQNTEEDALLWENWLKNNPENNAIFSEAKETILFIDKNKKKASNDKIQNEVFTELMERIEYEKKKVNNQRTLLPVFLKIAAAIIIIIGIGWLLKSGIESFQQSKQYVMVHVPYGQQKTLYLPDSSVAWINSGGQLKYPKMFNSKSREVEVSGEVYLKVKHNSSKPFIVKANDKFSVKVLGTEFNIKCDAKSNTYETTLFQGLVEISTGKNEKAILHPSEKAVITKNLIKTIQLSDKELKTLLCWKEDTIVFKGETFEDIARMLEIFYGTRIYITSSELMHEKFTGSCSKQESIYQVLDVFKHTESIEYSVKNGSIVIFKKH